MNEFKFEFSLTKLAHSIAYFHVAGWDDLTKLKLAKLFYFADKAHLLEHASPILGDVYYCMDFGPVPSFALNLMNEAISRRDAEGIEADSPDWEVMDSVLKVRKGFWDKHPRFEARHGFEKSVFSGSELEILQTVSRRYGGMSASDLVTLTHQEPTWCVPNRDRQNGSRAPIPYDLFFKDCDEVGLRSYALLVARFRGEVVPLAGDSEYQEFASQLLDDDTELDWSLDRDQERRVALQFME